MFTARLRLILLAVVWVSSLAAVWLWLGSSQVDRLAVGAGSRGSEAYQLSSALAAVLQRQDNRLEISVFETGGSVENLDLLTRGEIDIATIQADTTVPDGVLAVAELYRDAYHLIVRDSSGIHSLADLAGKRVATPPEESGQYGSFWFLMNHYGLGPDDLIALPMSGSAADFAMVMEQVDAVFRVRAPGNDSISSLIGEYDMRIVPIGQAAALSLKQPALAQGFIPHGSYRGHPPLPAADLPTAIVPRLLVVREDMREDLAYRFTRELFESRSDIVAISRLGGLIAPLGDDAHNVLPAHPGARRYFDREKPGIMQQNARLASTGLYALVLLSSAAVALRSQWMKTRRLRMGEFNRRLMAMAEKARGQQDTGVLMGLKQQLMDVLAEVVLELDRDKVSQSEFEHFSFTWQAVDALVRDQMMMVERLPRDASVGDPAGVNAA